MTFAGRVPPADIWRYYADADIYLQTPDIDNMPASVLEAFASGCAVVATNAGGVPAILTDDVHGLLVDCGDHPAAAERSSACSTTRARATPDRRPPVDSCAEYQWSSVRAQWVALYGAWSPPGGGRGATTSAV